MIQKMVNILKRKRQKQITKTQKTLLKINNKYLKGKMKKSEKVQLLEEVQKKMEISSEIANQKELKASVM